MNSLCIYFGNDEKNTIRAIHILLHTEFQYFNPSILATRHTPIYLPQALPPDLDTFFFRVPQYLVWLFQLSIGSEQQSCTTVFFILNFSPLQRGLLIYLRSTFFHHFRDTSSFDNYPHLSYILQYLAHNTPPPFDKLIRDMCIAPY